MGPASRRVGYDVARPLVFGLNAKAARVPVMRKLHVVSTHALACSSRGGAHAFVRPLLDLLTNGSGNFCAPCALAICDTSVIINNGWCHITEPAALDGSMSPEGADEGREFVPSRELKFRGESCLSERPSRTRQRAPGRLQTSSRSTGRRTPCTSEPATSCLGASLTS